MTWFADLAPCTYHRWPGDRLAIGWLGADHPFTQKPIAPALRAEIFLDRLFWAVSHRRVDQFRGYHTCELCPEHAFGPTWVEHKGERVATGSAQVDFSAIDGQHRYVAPNLIAHYITEHGYHPPEEFIDAVILGTMNAEVRDAGTLILSSTEREVVHDSLIRELVIAELAERFGVPTQSIQGVITAEVIRVGRMLESIPETLPALHLAIDVDGPIRRMGWTEWAPTKDATSDAIDRMFENDNVLREAIEEALTT